MFSTENEDSVLKKQELNASRYRLGIANLFFTGEESSLGGISVFIIRAMGGNDAHFGFVSCFGSLVAFLQCLAVPVLNFFRSNRKAMCFALGLGAFCGVLLATSGLGANATGSLQQWMLYAFIASSLLMSIATGIQTTIETSWIGDLVPQSLRGWFYSVKTVVSIIGMVVLSLLFGFLVDNSPELSKSAFWLYLVVALSHVMAISIILKIPDRKPLPAKVFARKDDKEARMDFKNASFWKFCGFYITWAMGRNIFFVFYSIFLLTEFNFGLLKLNSLNVLTMLLSVVAVMVAGKLSDVKGNRRLLMLVSTSVGCAMLLFQLTPWFGLVPIIVYVLINSMAGATHTMLINNYMLEIIPAEGRAAYVSFARILVGVGGLLSSLAAGAVGRALELHQWSLKIGGFSFSRYHLMFFAGAVIAASSSLWLIFIKPQENTKIIESQNE